MIKLIESAPVVNNDAPPAWHADFLAMLPAIRTVAGCAFARCGAELREELTAEIIANCCVQYARLVERGKTSSAYPTVLAWYAVRRIRDGRFVGQPKRKNDVYSYSAQVEGRFALEHIGTPDNQHGASLDSTNNGWREQLTYDRRTTPADLARFRMDFDAWLPMLSKRNRTIALALAMGDSGNEIADRYSVSAGRISQIKNQLLESWGAFMGEDSDD